MAELRREKQQVSGFLAVCVWLSLHRGKGWEREVKFCGRINKGERNTGQCFSIELQFTCKKSDKSEQNRKNGLKFNIGRLCSWPFNF